MSLEGLIGNIAEGIEEAHRNGRHVSSHPSDRAYFDSVCHLCAGLIDATQPNAQHVTLTCDRHPELRWFTKNIDFIGARSIFYTGSPDTECDCPIGLLRVVRDEIAPSESEKERDA